MACGITVYFQRPFDNTIKPFPLFHFFFINVASMLPLLATLMCHKVGIFLLLFLWAFSLIKIKCVHSCNPICPLQWKSMRRALAAQAAEVLLCSLCPLYAFAHLAFHHPMFSDVSETYQIILRSQPHYKQSVCLCLASLCIWSEQQRVGFFFFFFPPSICPGEWVQKSTTLLLIYVLFWFRVARTSEEDGFLEG